MSQDISRSDIQVKSTTDAATFETAISATEFGKFNLLLAVMIIFAGWANSIESTTMSYVFPAAQCDLDLTLQDKGLLNAITYTGMISSAVMWGFLFDTLGRRKLLMVGYFLNFVCVSMSALSQNKIMLIVWKFFGGFIINGPYAALSTYISEFHSAKNRGRMQLLISFIFGCGGIVLAWVAGIILSTPFNFSLFNSTLTFHSWNILLLICSIPSIASGLIFIFMPESPKFLMTVGENQKALSLFKKMYSINTGRQQESFPIKELIDENKLTITPQRDKITALKEGWQQMKPLFFAPHFQNILLVCLIQALFTMNVNTLRLWLPQIFQSLNDYQQIFNTSSADICKSLEMIKPDETTCNFNVDNMSVYVNTSIVNVTVMLSQFLTGCFINSIGKKKLLFILGTVSGGFAFALYFSTNVDFAVAFSAVYTGLSGAAANVITVINIELFPTTLRTTTLSLALMCGRIGSMIGNLLFPYLIQAGCAPPFFVVGSLVIVCSFLSLLLPDIHLKDLE